MVKSLRKVASLLTAGALLFGGLFLSCSDDSGDSFESKTTTVDVATFADEGVTITSVSVDSLSPEGIVTATANGTTLTLVSKKAGTTTLTIKVSGTEGDEAFTDEEVQITVTVDSKGAITYQVIEDEGEDETVTYAWTFSDITKDDIGAEALTSGTYSGKYVLAADYKYKSTPEGLVLTLGKGDGSAGPVYNKIDETTTVGQSSQTEIYGTASVGAVEPMGELLVLKNLTGPFTVEMIVSSNSSSDKTDRYAYIKIGDEEVTAPSKATTTIPVAGQILSYEYTGTDKVTVTLGCSNMYMRVYDVKVTTSAAQDQSDGTVITFTSATNSDTANTVDTLGLVGASASSSDDTIATAAIADGKIAVTSVAEGTATITVTDANSKTASFKAIVAEDGTVTIGTITKFERSAPTATATTKASSETATDGVVTVTYDGLTDLEYSNDNETFADAETAGVTVSISEDKTTVTVSALAAGTYYVRGSASDAYAATTAASVTLSYEGVTKTTDSWTLSKDAMEALTIVGYTYSKTNNNDYTYTAVAALSSTTSTVLASDYTLAGASGNLNLTISKYSGTGVGITKAEVETAPDWSATTGNKIGNSLCWKTHSSGLILKRDGIKIAGVKGSVKLTIKWGCTAEKDSGDGRKLEVTVGDGKTVQTDLNYGSATDGLKSTKAQPDYTLDIEGGSDGVDVYIGASNELYIKSITIE